MSLYTDIKFSGNLIQNQKVNITYSGDLFKNNSDAVTIVYGFSDNWNHTTEKRMEKTEDGFTAEIRLLDYDKFNFCFRNSNYEWDNNNYQNYTSPISEPVIEEENFIINENVIVEILDNIFEKDISKIENDVIENIVEKTEDSQNETAEFSIDIEKDEPVAIEESIVNITEETSLNNTIENVFNDIYEEDDAGVQNIVTENTITSNIIAEVDIDAETNIDANTNTDIDITAEVDINMDVVETDVTTEQVAEFDMNNLIDEILSPIVHSSTFEEDTVSSIETFKQETEENNNADNVELFEQIDDSEESIVSIIDNLYTDVVDVLNNVLEVQTTSEEATITTVNETDIETEAPLMDVLNTEVSETTSSETALIEVDTKNEFLVSARSLGKFYKFKKKVKLAFYKVFVGIPRMLSRAFNEGKTDK